MSEPRTRAGADLDAWNGPILPSERRRRICAIEDEMLDKVAKAVDTDIFDLPIGNDVTYSRGYSAGTAAARESLRAAIERIRRDDDGPV